MVNKTIYLCGPIAGISYKEATNGWRSEISNYLDADIKTISPMRGKDHLKDVESFEKRGNYDTNINSTGKAIITRDYFDVKNCDLILANFLGAERVSIGSCFELAWAYAMQKPVVLVIDEKNIHIHDFVLETCGYITHDLRKACDSINKFFKEY